MQAFDNQHPMPKPVEKIILLADLDLMEFPLESLKFIQKNFGVHSIARDFSLQFFATRFNLLKESNY